MNKNRLVLGFKVVLVAALLAADFFIFSTMADAADAASRIAVAPLKYNGPKDSEYVKDAAFDMLITRIDAKGIEAAVLNLNGKPVAGPLTDAEAAEVSKKSGTGYLLYGSISILGSSISMDAKLLNAKNNSVETIFAKGEKLDSLVAMTEYVASEAEKLIKGASAAAAPVAVKEEGSTKAAAPIAPSYTGKFGGGKSQEAEKVVTPQPVGKGDSGEKGVALSGKSPASHGKASFKSNLPQGMFVAIDVYDLNGDGVNEAIVVKDNVVLILNYTGNGFKEVKTLMSNGASVVSLTRFDYDGDGKEDIFVSRAKTFGADTCILKYSKAGYELASCGIPYVVHAVSAGGGAKKLLGQGLSFEQGFKSKMYELEFKNGKAVEKSVFELSGVSDIFGLEFVDIDGDGTLELVYLDKNDYVRVMKNSGGGWSEEWRSAEYYGGSLNYVEIKKGGASQGEFAVVKESIYVVDLDGNGDKEVVLKQNVAGGALGRKSLKVASFKSGAIAGLEWDGAMLSEKWKSKEVSGYIADFRVTDVDGDGVLDVVMLVRADKDGKKNYILSYKLKL